MHLTILSYVGDEEDIIEACARHHAMHAQRLAFVTTGSDRTEDILRLLAAEGLPIDVRPHRPAYHDQHEVLSALLRETAAATDWILPLDADEFLLGDVPQALSVLPADRPVLLPWRTYVPDPVDDDAEPNVLRRITRRRAEELPQFRKVLIPAHIVSASTCIEPGNHALADIAGDESDLLAIAHFPVRTQEQLLRKVRSGWQAVLRNPARRANEAAHWGAMHERLESHASIAPEKLQSIALRYAMADDAPAPALVHDPVPHAFSLRYSADAVSKP